MSSGLQQPPLTSGEGLKSFLQRLKSPHGCTSTKSKLWNASSADNAIRNNLGIFKSLAMSYSEPITLECKCGCGEIFKTRNSVKKYVYPSHQKENNNIVQNAKYRALNKLEAKQRKTLEIYRKMMGNRTRIHRSREFLRGAGADLGILTHYTPYNGKQQPTLHDVMIINDPKDANYVYLQKASDE